MSRRPAVSVVVESVNVRVDGHQPAPPGALQPVLEGLGRQTGLDFEVVVVVGPGESLGSLGDECPARLRTVVAHSDNYFAAKNDGARQAGGDLIFFLDSDTVPAPHWLDSMVTAFRPGVEVVAGRTTYTGRSLTSRALSRMTLAVRTGPDGHATGFVANNVGFRQEVFLAHLFDERIPRHGGCYLLYHQLRGEGVGIAYAPEAEVYHGLDPRALRHLRKQYDRGRDAVLVHHLDQQCVLAGTRWRRAHPLLAPVAINMRRMGLDLKGLATSRTRSPVRAADVPGAAVLTVASRVAGLAGELNETVRPSRRGPPPLG